MIKNRFFLIIFVISSLVFVEGCVPVLVAGGAAGVGKALYQDKTVGEAVSDQTVWAKIRAAFINADIDSLVGSVNVKVSEGRVLLTGTVSSREDMVKIIKICWQQTGVKEVINELKLSKDNDTSLKQYAHDSWITTRLKSKLFFTKNIKSVNYNIITIDGVVYIIGIAQSQENLSKVTDIASQISGVKEVVSYIRVKKSTDEVTGEDGVSDDSIDVFDKEDVDKAKEESKTQELPKTKEEKPISEPKPKASAPKSTPKKDKDDIFSEEDFESF